MSKCWENFEDTTNETVLTVKGGANLLLCLQEAAEYSVRTSSVIWFTHNGRRFHISGEEILQWLSTHWTTVEI